METLIIVLLIIIIVGLLVTTFLIFKKKPVDNNAEANKLLLQQINELSRTIDNKLGESQKEINQTMRFQSTETSRIIADITEKITRLDETNKQVLDFSKQLERNSKRETRIAYAAFFIECKSFVKCRQSTDNHEIESSVVLQIRKTKAVVTK